MKYLFKLFVICAMILPFSLNAQLIKENTYDKVSAGVTNLGANGYKYYTMDVENSQCHIYNLDHSLWKTINLSLPKDYYLVDIQWVSTHLFNTDDNVEMVYMSAYYDTILSYYTYNTRIADETGKQLLDVPGGGYYALMKTSAGYKLLVYEYDFSNYIYGINTHVFSVPGQPEAVEGGMNVAPSIMAGELFPNPADGKVCLPYQLNHPQQKAMLNILDANGRNIQSYMLDPGKTSFINDATELASGVYYYLITNEKGTQIVRKLIKQ
ncbi:MAG: T9SS type A sorting domain-containing protein [Bacteroidales bacterium]|nr:T9SS type A sorting domain-containing protein [Bacteroidales bacterium]